MSTQQSNYDFHLCMISWIKKIVFLSFSLVLISCGADRAMVNNVEISTSVEQNGDILMALTADLGIGNLQLPNASFPILLPKDGREIGIVSLVGSLGGKNILSIDINLSEAANLDLTDTRLPNGAMIPLIADNPVLVIPVGKVMVYLSLVEGAQVLGVSVPIRSFDKVGSKVGTTVLMPIFNKNGTIGAAGIYTSRQVGASGIAVVADISGKLSELPSFENQLIMPQMEQISLDYSTQGPSRAQKKNIDRELYKLHKKREVLRLK